jgi:hypothetical protein
MGKEARFITAILLCALVWIAKLTGAYPCKSDQIRPRTLAIPAASARCCAWIKANAYRSASEPWRLIAFEMWIVSGEH